MAAAWSLAPTRPGAFELHGAHIALLLKRSGYAPSPKKPAPAAPARPPKPAEPLALPFYWAWNVSRNAWCKARIYY